MLHEAPLFKWTGDNASVLYVNMSARGELRSALQRILADGGRSKVDEPLKRFSWDALVPKYIQMYEQVDQRDSQTGHVF